LSIKAYAQVRYIETVQARYFSPAPKVDSAIILIDSISKDFFGDFSEKAFFTVLKTGFAHKRKVLQGNLKAEFDQKSIATSFSELAIDPKSRAEDIPLEKWRLLTSFLVKK
jgi:16S rRNA (adenine1518-N6/adenine1519-N6)-dimethyltransferase